MFKKIIENIQKEFFPQKINESNIEQEIGKLINRYDCKKEEDGSYSFGGDVNLNGLGMTELPIKFKEVVGYFIVADNKLISMKNSPETVGGIADYSNNRIISLVEAPKEIGGSFNISNNLLTSPENGPTKVKGDYYCDNNKVVFNEEDIKKVTEVGGKIVTEVDYPNASYYSSFPEEKAIKDRVTKHLLNVFGSDYTNKINRYVKFNQHENLFKKGLKPFGKTPEELKGYEEDFKNYLKEWGIE
jgi:hypothetical protein